jgi:arylsulfatase A-like enzyme
VDQTALAPTILDLAGLPIPDWMHGQSLVAWLNREENGQGEGLAFTQYVERNSIFRPLHRGSIGVIDGEYQYVFYLDTQKGVLRPLKQAQIWDLDESSENPARVEALHAAIHAKFPDAVPAK